MTGLLLYSYHQFHRKSAICAAVAAAFIIILCISPASAWERQPQWVLNTDAGIWTTTPSGLFRYDPDGELFTPESFPDNPVFIPFEIATDGEQLWAVSDSLAGYLDFFGGGRYIYSASEGLPPGKLTCIAFEDDFIWIGSENGVSRFDRLIEQWEYFPLTHAGWTENAGKIYKIEPVDNYVYFATADGIIRFDTQTETFLRYGVKDGLKGGVYRDLRRFGDELWFFGEAGIDIYTISQQNWSFIDEEQGFRSTQWIDIEEISGSLYFLSDLGIDICEISNRQVYPFEREEYLTSYAIKDFFGSESQIWFGSDKGLLFYQRDDPQSNQSEMWILYDEGRGASVTKCQHISGAGDILFSRDAETMDVLDQSGDIFLSPLEFTQSGLRTGPQAHGNNLKWDDEGLRLTSKGGSSLGLTGNLNYLFLNDEISSEDRLWGILQPYFIHSSGRSATGLYNNTDQEEILYGATYRGLDGDLIRRVEGGNRLKYQQNFDLFFGDATLRGGSVTMESGPREGRKKRSMFRNDFTVGEIITHSKREFFDGSQGPIYFLEHQDLLIGSAEVYLNGRQMTESEFSLNYNLGQFWFTFTGWELLSEGDRIEVLYQYRLDEAEIGEQLIADEIVFSKGDKFQVSLTGFDKSENQTDTTDSADAKSAQGMQIAAEFRDKIQGGEAIITAGYGVGKEDTEGSQAANTGTVSGSYHKNAWTLNGKWLSISDELPTFEDRSTEFGNLEEEKQFEIRYEPSGKFNLTGETSDKSGEFGSEKNYRLAGQYSPMSGTSTFGSFDFFDAALDSLDRERWIASLGMETAFAQSLLNSLKIRSSRLLIISKLSDIKLDSLFASDSARIHLQTKSLITRWSLVPSSKVNFYPEVRLSSKDQALNDGALKPFRREIAPKAVLYTRNLIPGITSYINSEAAYVQDNFDDAAGTRNLGFEREGVAQIDVTPGIYLSTLNPVSLRLNVIRNAEDSLVGMNDDYDFFDIGLGWQDFPQNVQSLRYDSDAMQFTWTPHSNWLFYQSMSEIRATSIETEQFFSSRIEWKPRSSEQIFLKYTLNRTPGAADDGLRHRPGVEWYKRWSSSTYTRGQFFATIVNDAGENSVALSPGMYLDKRWQFPGRWGKVSWRTDLLLTYFNQTAPIEDKKTILGGYTRLDWSILSKLIFRVRFDGDFENSYTTSSSDFIWSMETRLSVHF